MHELCFFHTCPSLGVKRVTGDGFITRGAVMFIALIIVIQAYPGLSGLVMQAATQV